MSKKRKTIIATGLFVAFMACIGFLYWNNARIFDVGQTTVGTLSTHGDSFRWKYKVNGWQHFGSMGVRGHRYLYPGEKYIVYYDSSNPHRSMIDLLHPVIDTPAFDQTISLPCHEELEKGSELISFSYVVSGVVYHRSHQVLCTKKFFGNGLTYKVLYNKIEPRIAYIDITTAVEME